MVHFAPGRGLVTTVHDWVKSKTGLQTMIGRVLKVLGIIYSAKMCLRRKTPPRLGHLALASEVAGGLIYHFKIGSPIIPCLFLNGKVCPPATSEAGGRS
jgi:hypothetical protein